jgi:hypothetical protein
MSALGQKQTCNAKEHVRSTPDSDIDWGPSPLLSCASRVRPCVRCGGYLTRRVEASRRVPGNVLRARVRDRIDAAPRGRPSPGMDQQNIGRREQAARRGSRYSADARSLAVSVITRRRTVSETLWRSERHESEISAHQSPAFCQGQPDCHLGPHHQGHALGWRRASRDQQVHAGSDERRL